jgi:hypothetical protein
MFTIGLLLVTSLQHSFKPLKATILHLIFGQMFSTKSGLAGAVNNSFVLDAQSESKVIVEE